VAEAEEGGHVAVQTFQLGAGGSKVIGGEGFLKEAEFVAGLMGGG
jgi:hypothetical protein